MIENGVKVLYVEILRAIYGMLEAALMWYKKFRTDLEGIGFVFNPYDPCIAQRTVRGKQHLIRFHVDDVLSSHEESEVNDEFATWAQKLYGTVKPVEVQRGKVHTFLGMKLDFSEAKECHVLQEDHVDELVSSWPRKNKNDRKVLTPSAANLFEKGTGELLCNDEREIFHSAVARSLFIANRSRPDILPTVSVLASRVSAPNPRRLEEGRPINSVPGGYKAFTFDFAV